MILPQRRSVLSQADTEAICGIAVAQLLAFSEGCGAWRSRAARMALSRRGHTKPLALAIVQAIRD